MARELAVVLMSGGMDSCVTAAITAQTFDIAALHANYGQRTEQRELQSFNAIADHFHAVQRLVVDLTHLARIGGSSLTDRSIPVERANLERTDIPSSYVPFRNANLLAVAVSWGEVLGARRIFVGAVEEDSSGYPDCRRGFFDAYNAMIAWGTKPDTHITIETPLIHASKADIVAKGVALGAPLDLSWSCYVNDDIACGECDSCALRLRGFRKAGVEDPITYRIRN